MATTAPPKNQATDDPLLLLAILTEKIRGGQVRVVNHGLYQQPEYGYSGRMDVHFTIEALERPVYPRGVISALSLDDLDGPVDTKQTRVRDTAEDIGRDMREVEAIRDARRYMGETVPPDIADSFTSFGMLSRAFQQGVIGVEAFKRAAERLKNEGVMFGNGKPQPREPAFAPDWSPDELLYEDPPVVTGGRRQGKTAAREAAKAIPDTKAEPQKRQLILD